MVRNGYETKEFLDCEYFGSNCEPFDCHRFLHAVGEADNTGLQLAEMCPEEREFYLKTLGQIGSGSTEHAQRAMVALSEMLEDFPPKVDKKFNSSSEFMQYYYEWMSKQKEWRLIR